MKARLPDGMTVRQLLAFVGRQKAIAEMLRMEGQAVYNWRSADQMPGYALLMLAATIERNSMGRITRQMLFPRDWRVIWPELVDQEILDIAECIAPQGLD